MKQLDHSVQSWMPSSTQENQCLSLFSLLQVTPQFDKDVSLWLGEASKLYFQERAHLHWLSRAEACLSETNNIDSHWKGAGFFQVRRSCLTTMVVVPSCCKAMRSMQLSTFGIEWRLAHQNSARDFLIMLIPVCADMGQHSMVFWSCRWPLPPAVR